MHKFKLYGFEYNERSGCGCCHNESYYSPLFTSEDEMISWLLNYPSSQYNISCFYIEAVREGFLILIEDSDYGNSGLYYKIDDEDYDFDKIRINFSTGIMREIESNGTAL